MERSIEIRTLAGESITVGISVDVSVGDLKALLRSSFLPAKESPNFHLFFKGAKLSLHSSIGSHTVKQGEFMVLVPFVRKSQRAPTECDSFGYIPPNCSRESSMSLAADSAWHDIMSDLSSLSDVSKSDTVTSSSFSRLDNIPEDEEELVGRTSSSFSRLDNIPEDEEELVGRTSSSFSRLDNIPEDEEELVGRSSRKYGWSNRKRKLDGEHPLHDLLCLNSKNFFHTQRSGWAGHIADSGSCLSHADSGNCLLYGEFFKGTSVADQCVCPSWLRRVMKSFTFLNLLYAQSKIFRECLTWDYIEEALKRLGSFGPDKICISDIKVLSVLCPQIVRTLGKQEKILTRSGSTIMIGTSYGNHSESTDIQRTASKKASVSAAIIAFENRTIAFKLKLWTSVKCCMERKLKIIMPPMLPLDVHILMEDIIATSESNDVTLEKVRSSAALCYGLQAMEPAEMVEHLQKGLGKHGQIVHVEKIDAKDAIYVELPMVLSELIKAALKGIGISKLYNHQAEAIQASLSGKNVVVATSTSSGKSLCYNIPVLESLSHSPLACALYIFPMKALAQDQLRALLDMTKNLNIGLDIGVYDGDTSQERRAWIRDNARLLISNPDMLHMSILPNHRNFERILSNLRYIVIDEIHTYKGAFGCHTALVLRRLRRICSHEYGSDPSFILCTATSANPCEHAMELCNLQNLELIQRDGSPCGSKYFLLWNPPVCLESKTLSGKSNNNTVKRDILTRRSSPLEVSRLLAEMIQHGLRCIAFCKSRKQSEWVLYNTREILRETAPNLVKSVFVYRAGYTPQDRRQIEADLFEGKLRGVAATNALELGIDVGSIDATLHLGFPGSVSSLWQQAGRSGRRARPSLAVYVAFEGPLDQYFMKYPHKLFGSAIEHCHVDSHNKKVLEQHVACAAFELPLCIDHDEKYFGSGLGCAINALRNDGYLGNPFGVSSSKLWNYIGPERTPSRAVSIRAIEANKYKVVDISRNEVLEEIEASRAFFQVYEGAVYMNQGITYLVKDLDLSAKVAYCQKADLKYYTKTRDSTDIYVVGSHIAYPSMTTSKLGHVRTTAQANACKVTTRWFGFHRICKASKQIIDTVDLYLPAYSYQSQAVWIQVPQSIKTTLKAGNLPLRAGLHAASHALLNVVPLYMMCNSNDLGTECPNPHETRSSSERILLYDRHPGGIGITLQVQLLFRELLTAAFELVSTCGCLSNVGCPNCVQMFSCGEYNAVLDKAVALVILKGVIEAERSYFEGNENSV